MIQVSVQVGYVQQMAQKRSTLRSVGTFALTILPVTGVIALLLASFDLATPSVRIGYPLGFLVTATIAYAISVAVMADIRSRLMSSYHWMFPLSSGILINLFTFCGLVEDSTDVIGRLVGHRHQNLMLIGSIAAWTVVSTIISLGFDRYLPGNLRDPNAAMS